MITICLTHFKSLTLANLSAALHSVRQQDFTHVEKMIVCDNDTNTDSAELLDVVDALNFPMPVSIIRLEHGDVRKTHAYSTNQIVERVKTDWIFFTRADYILHFDALKRFGTETKWGEFGTSYFKHLHVGVDDVERTSWRVNGTDMLMPLPGLTEQYGEIDSGVWLLQTALFHKVGGLDESLTAWGHAQTHFQHKLFLAGVKFRTISEVLFYHPIHGGARDLGLANQQIENLGITPREMWERYSGANPYR